MKVDELLKPLYANLKRLWVGDFLMSEAFRLFLIEHDLDEKWNTLSETVPTEIRISKEVSFERETQEEILIRLMSLQFANDYYTFDNFIIPFVEEFALWRKDNPDFSKVLASVRKVGVSQGNVERARRNIGEMQLARRDAGTRNDRITPNENLGKIFLVHGSDLASKLELCAILKDEFGISPVVLQDSGHDLIETIMGKFERLASDCSAAIVLFTPDDHSGDNRRARQNVIFELGYFLGKFQSLQERKILILKKGEIEIPSDLSGVLLSNYNKSVKEAFYELRLCLKRWGYVPVDENS